MAQIVVRGIAEEDVKVLDARAKRHGRSREEEVRRLIAETVADERAWRSFFRRAEALRERVRKRYGTLRDSAELIREDRDVR